MVIEGLVWVRAAEMIRKSSTYITLPWFLSFFPDLMCLCLCYKIRSRENDRRLGRSGKFSLKLPVSEKFYPTSLMVNLLRSCLIMHDNLDKPNEKFEFLQVR